MVQCYEGHISFMLLYFLFSHIYVSKMLAENKLFDKNVNVTSYVCTPLKLGRKIQLPTYINIIQLQLISNL